MHLGDIRFSEIRDGDLNDVADLYTSAFPYSRASWVKAFRRLSLYTPPDGYPRYGHLMRCNGTVVGAILTIYSAIHAEDQVKVRCSVSNWYVLPAFRIAATALATRAIRLPDVTYFVITPTTHMLPILEAQGYIRYCDGRFHALPALSAPVNGARLEMVRNGARLRSDLPQHEANLLLDHLAYDCIGVQCRENGMTYPFVFATRRKHGLLPFASLIYCRNMADFVRFAGNLGRLLTLRGFPLVLIDANGVIPGLHGSYASGYPKYYRGPEHPRLGDLAYSKRVFLGI